MTDASSSTNPRPTPRSNGFVHLHVHSHFSFMDGAASLDGLLAKAAGFGMDTLALTDHQGLYGAIRFYKKAKAAGIKPIIGVEVAVRLDGREDDGADGAGGAAADMGDMGAYAPGGHLVLLAQDKRGYQSLCRLLSEGHAMWGSAMGYGSRELSAGADAGATATAGATAAGDPCGAAEGAGGAQQDHQGDEVPVGHHDLFDRLTADGQLLPEDSPYGSPDESGWEAPSSRDIARFRRTAPERHLASAKTASLSLRPETMLVDLDMLRRHSAGLIALSGCSRGEVGRAVLAGDIPGAQRAAARYQDIYGAGSFFIELQSHQLPWSLRYMNGLVQVAEWLREKGRERGQEKAGQSGKSETKESRGSWRWPLRSSTASGPLPLVLTNNVHYVEEADHRVHDVLSAVGMNMTLPGPLARENSELYFKSPEQMKRLLRGIPREAARDAWQNTRRIADRCDLDLELGSFHFPDFTIPKEETHYSILAKTVWHGAEERYQVITPEVVARIEHELALIEKMGFSAYFLIVKDIVDFARGRDIPCSGRGSAGDSIISYCLGITSVDPIAADLLFERFLNPMRKDMPDIDVDLCSVRRDEVVRYIYERYGRDRVAMVATVNTMTGRSALRVAGKAFGYTDAEMSEFTRHMPWIKARDIRASLARYPELADCPLHDEERFGMLLDIVEKLDGCPMHLGTHLGGFVITPGPINSVVPLQWAAKGTVVAQFDKDDIEALGLVKMDILGLRTHSAVAEASRRVAALTGAPFDPYELPRDDPAAYKLIRSANTIGLFQLESSGQRNLAGRLQEEDFEDIVVAISLFRPGPLEGDMIKPFIRRRHGLEPVKVAHPSMEKPLRGTYGVIVYQEQVLSVAAAVAGFDLAEADMLRRAMTTDKSMEEMDRIGEHFVERAVERGVGKADAQEVFRQLRGFAAYGFNKAHAACFAVISYATAWLKAHYPAEFLTGILNHQPMGFYSPRVVLNDARHCGIAILPPDINASYGDFEPVYRDGRAGGAFSGGAAGASSIGAGVGAGLRPLLGGKPAPEGGAYGIRVGLKYLRDLSGTEIDRVESERARGGLYRSLADLYRRTGLSRPSLENLIKVGALDSLGAARGALLAELAILHELHGKGKSMANLSEYAARGNRRGHYDSSHPSGWSRAQRLDTEIELMGLNITCHPLTPHRDEIQELGATFSRDLSSVPDRSRVTVVGLRERAQTPPTRSRKRTLFLTLEDETGLLDVVVFTDTLERYGLVLARNRSYIVEGVLQNNDERGLAIVADRIEAFVPHGSSLASRSRGRGLAGNSAPGMPA